LKFSRIKSTTLGLGGFDYITNLLGEVGAEFLLGLYELRHIYS
jgi:hypothetical protein